VVGGGPAGTFFSYFLLRLAKDVGLKIDVDLYEPRDFWGVGPASCNMCGGIISESLVQYLALEGINLPPTIVQKTIDSYTLHTFEGWVRIETPLHEMRIAAVYRAGGPRGVEGIEWGSFDGYLLTRAIEEGVFLRQERVAGIEYNSDQPRICVKDQEPQQYDLVAVATGVNSPITRKLEESIEGYKPPKTERTFLREYFFPPERLESLGSSMHIFLPNIPRLEFAAVIPKGTHASTCILGEDVSKPMLQIFMTSAEVMGAMPQSWDPTINTCQCAPRINIGGASQPFKDRLVFVGDAAVTRLYKDGIGAAYRTAKSAAATAVLQGISMEDFRLHYWPTCTAIEKDNRIGRLMFAVTNLIQKRHFVRVAILRMAANEQDKPGASRGMSMVLWDLFTGSAPYRDILMRTLHPVFLGRLFWYLISSLVLRKPYVQQHNAPVQEQTEGAKREVG